MYRQATDVAATAGGEEDYVDGMLLQATDVAATAGGEEDNVECCCRLLMWQQQQEEKKIMWNVSTGY
jgi:hypothetical protein